MPRLVLGSASPRRADLLREIGAVFAIRPSDIPEVPGPDEPPSTFARRVAREKGSAVAAAEPGAWVIAADTVVVLDASALGKPRDACEARAMLVALSGRTHQVVTAVALLRPGGMLAGEAVVETTVAMRRLSEAEIDAYIGTGEPFDKAGAYGIQGPASAFIAHVDGSYTNVVGLPVDEVRALLDRFGLLPDAAAGRSAARR
jgi:septum formation protein